MTEFTPEWIEEWKHNNIPISGTLYTKSTLFDEALNEILYFQSRVQELKLQTDKNSWKELKLRAKLSERIAELEAEQRWIPVSERLPEKDSTEQYEMKLCLCDDFGELRTIPLYFIGGSWYPHYNHTYVKYDKYVRAWKDLSKPTKDGDA